MKDRCGILPTLIFTVFIGAFFILNLAMPDRDFSQRENRALQQLPKLTAASLFSGGYMKDYEKYAADQFAFRDTWMPLKARTELLSGKRENNGVYYGEGETLVKRFDEPDAQKLSVKVDAINAFASKADVPVYFGLIPGASDIWSAKLPRNAPNASQKAVIDECYSRCSAKCVDLYSALSARSGEYVYYRTDHHWTSLGAYYGYQALSGVMDFTAADVSSYDRKTVSADFCGTNWSSSGFTWVRPDSIETFVDSDGITAESYLKGTNSAPTSVGLYDTEYLAKKDKYSMFLGGVTPLLHITTQQSSAPSLLIIRDSYADSLAPFLTANYSNIYLVDLRYFRQSVSDFVKEHDIDSVLILYSVSNFSTDDNIVTLGA